MHPSSQSGLTRIEFLFLVGLILVVVLIGCIPFSHYLAQARLNHAVQGAHTLSTLLSQYATDNDGVYPVGEGTPAIGKSEGIARNFLEANYLPDAGIFAVGSTPRYSGTAQDFSDLVPANMSWDFTAGATATTGIHSDAPDELPVVYTTGQNVAYPATAHSGLDLSFSSSGPFGPAGMVVAYKNNQAVFIRAEASGTKTVCRGFISTSYGGTGTYTQIKP